MNAIAALNPAVFLIVGDLCYADGYSPIWDNFGRMLQTVAAKVPMFAAGGDHEFGHTENSLPFSMRYPAPSSASGSTSYCYYGKEIGVIHLISLCSYGNIFNSSMQYAWLSNYLNTSINRAKTPWVVVMLHAPWYSSSPQNWMQGELMRESFEALLYAAGVDMIYTGHVHSYERTQPVYNNKINPCGIIHTSLGDGGNSEGLWTNWTTVISNNILVWLVWF